MRLAVLAAFDVLNRLSEFQRRRVAEACLAEFIPKISHLSDLFPLVWITPEQVVTGGT
jgi:hypothetical protein